MRGLINELEKKMTFIILVLIFTVSLAACGDAKENKNNNSNSDNQNEASSNNDDVSMNDEQILDVNIKSEPPSLHPGEANDTFSATVLDQIFEGLTRVDQNGEVTEAMAEEIEVSEDQTTYTFHIRENANWSNGDPVTAEDFEYAWKWILDPKNADTDYAYQLYPIKNAEDVKENGMPMDEVGITVEDEKKLIVELEQPTPYFLELTAFMTYYPLNKNIVEGNKDWSTEASEDYVTNGPFTLESWQHKDNIVLEKFEDYWDSKTVKLETINMHMIEDENTELNMFERGELDRAGAPTGSIPLAAIQSLKEENRLNISPKSGVFYYMFNTEEEPFTNKNIRKAFAYAIDRQGIIDNITQTEEIPAMALVPSAIFEENEVGYFKDNNMEEAKKYLEKGLEELGIDELPEITLSYFTDEENKNISEALQDMWKKNLGVDVILDNEEWQVYLNTMSEGDYQVGRLGWSGDFNDAINFLEIFQKGGGNNYANWENDAYSNLLKESKTESDPDKRYEIMRQAEEIFMEEMPVAPIFFYSNVWVQQENVHDIEVSPLGSVQYKWGWISDQ